MNPLLLAVVVALAVPLLTRGSYRRLAQAPWELVAVLLVGLGLQLLLDFDVVPEARWHDVGFGLLVASYVCVAGFCAVNLDRRGMGVVLVGVLANMLVIVVNHGMPVDVPQEWIDDGSYRETVKHHPQDADDSLLWLSDIIVLPRPFETVISFGDLVIVVGIIDVVYHASRRGRRRARRAARTTTDDQNEIDVATLLRVVDHYLSDLDASALAPAPRRTAHGATAPAATAAGEPAATPAGEPAAAGGRLVGTR
jgi:hypothetical protein